MNLSMACLVSSLAILEILLLEMFSKVCFEFSHRLVDLLMESILLPCDVSYGDSWVLVCRHFDFFEAVFCKSVYFFQYFDGVFSILSWRFVLLNWCPWGSLEVLLQRGYDLLQLSLFWDIMARIADWKSKNIWRLSFES